MFSRIRGYNIGVRLIEDFLSRTQQGRCYELKETAEILAKVRLKMRGATATTLVWCFVFQVGFKNFLGVVPTVANWNAKGDEFSLILDQNPLTDFVELPEDHPNLLYSNVICGVIRGALEMVKGSCYNKLLCVL